MASKGREGREGKRVSGFFRSEWTQAVGVEQVEGVGVHGQPAGGAAEGDPELLVEFTQAGQVGGVAEDRLVGAAKPGEGPAVRRGAIFYVRGHDAFGPRFPEGVPEKFLASPTGLSR
jgi:hypothetical protein